MTAPLVAGTWRREPGSASPPPDALRGAVRDVTSDPLLQPPDDRGHGVAAQGPEWVLAPPGSVGGADQFAPGAADAVEALDVVDGVTQRRVLGEREPQRVLCAAEQDQGGTEGLAP